MPFGCLFQGLRSNIHLPNIRSSFKAIPEKIYRSKMSTESCNSKDSGSVNTDLSVHSNKSLPTKQARRPSSSVEEPPSKISKGLLPLVDEHGFKRRQVYIDAENMSAYQRMGGDENKKNLKGYPKHRTMREEDEHTNYIIDGPLRRLEPYYFTYMTHCKERWIGRKILDVFSTEFRLYPRSYYVNALNEGRVSINNEVASIDSVLHNGDLISHRMHRHEPPVTSQPIRVIHEDKNYVVIDKPSGIPVHPTGRYRHNTVTFVLQKEHGIKAHPCNRLDRLTSGLMLLGKNGKAADRMSRILRERRVSKEYIAKVIGEFPATEEGIVVDKPLATIDPRLAFNAVDEEHGKPAKTYFKRISCDGETSIVLCKPLTGRTHQIRVHLQYLGHPIANDPLYSSPLIWGENLGKDAKFDLKDVTEKLSQVGKTRPASSWLHQKDDGEVLSDEKCTVCQGELYKDPGPNDLELYLHAYRYSSRDEGSAPVEERFKAEQQPKNPSKQQDQGTDVKPIEPWCYQTEFPEWALTTERKFMRMALDEAKKCVPTSTAFCVGAVLVNEGKVLSTGYSRELEGNTHAEQNALQKYFEKTGKKDVPPGTELYTTMEPCSKRLSGNLPCLNRILALKNHVTTCFVGVMEPSTFVAKNVSYDKLTHGGISYIKVPGFEREALEVAKRGHSVAAN